MSTNCHSHKIWSNNLHLFKLLFNHEVSRYIIKVNCSIYEFAKLRDIRDMRASVVYVPMCQSAKIPKECQLIIFLRANVPINVLTCQRCASYSTWCVNMPKANQCFNFACQKAYQFFNYFLRISQVLNFSIMLNICKFQEY